MWWPRGREGTNILNGAESGIAVESPRDSQERVKDGTAFLAVGVAMLLKLVGATENGGELVDV